MSFTRRNHGKDTITINLKLESTLSNFSCVKIVEDFLKYILYQRHQIPVNFDVLVREAAKGDSLEAQDTEVVAATPAYHCIKDPVFRKKEVIKQKLHRKRLQWLNKVKNLIDCFNTVIERLHSEFEEGGVRAVNIILGSSIMTGREVYSIKLPEDYTTQARPGALPPTASHSPLQLFRALVTNEDLLRVVNCPCGLQKVWVMLQKTCVASSSANTCPGSTIIRPETATSLSSLIPRPEYSRNIRAQVVEIDVQHLPSMCNSMDLTPCVGSGIACNSKVGTARSLYFNLPSVNRYYSPNKMHLNNSPDVCYPMSDSNFNLGKSEHENTIHKNFVKKNDCFAPCTANSSNKDILETPVKIFEGGVVSVQQPLTPSKQLTTRLGTVSLSDGGTETVWYQIDCLIYGFKDVYFKS